MGEKTSIEWTDATWNPWRGCSKVSPGCSHCYADSQAKRNPGTLGILGPNGTRVVAAEATWKEPLKWNRQAREAGERRLVFCASMADVFESWDGYPVDSSGARILLCDNCGRWHKDDKESDAESCEPGCGRFKQRMEWVKLADVRARLFRLIDQTPNLDWLLLTKRPENIARMMPAYFPGGYLAEAGIMNQEGHRPNVWLGASVENQAAADERIPLLLQTPAEVRFLSVEPLLGPVDLSKWLPGDVPDGYCEKDGYVIKGYEPNDYELVMYREHLDWVIVGGESGHHARPMHPDWARSIRDQCQAASVPFFFKQWGEWKPESSANCGLQNGGYAYGGRDIKGVSMLRDGRICLEQASPNEPLSVMNSEALATFTNQAPSDDENDAGYQWMARVGKKAAGRLLDGREWSEFPEAAR